jgi:hypothetical protein
MEEVESAMKTSPRLFAAALCVMSLGVAQALAATSATSGSQKVPSGLSFSYDAQHDQISASGVSALTMASPTITPTTGTINVTINIKLVTHFRRNTAIHCSLAAVGGQLDIVNQGIDGAIETVNGVATPDGSGSAVCKLTIPYSWSLPPDPIAVNGLILAFGASATQHEAWQDPVVQRSTLQVDGVESLPANGGTVSYVFDVAL